MSNFFSDETIDQLNEPLSKESVKTRDGTGNQKLSYLAAFHVINEANRIFGYGKWSTEIMHLHQVDKTEYIKIPDKEMVSISYTCHLKLTVTGVPSMVSHEDVGFGNGVAGNAAYGIASCIELASKEAVTDALKRCLRYYGNQFGLSLYDKDDQVQPLSDIEAAKLVTEYQLSELRDLYPTRGIDDKWIMAFLKSENYPLDSLELMRNDWYQFAFDKAYNYKLKEIEKTEYDLNIDKAIDMMKDSVTIGMLKGLFTEVWNKTGLYDDKQRQVQAKAIYDEMKEKFNA